MEMNRARRIRRIAGGIRGRLSYANVMATIAVFGVIAGGGAYAASKIGADDIAKNAVRAKHIKKGAVKKGKIADGAVSTAKLAGKARGVAVAGARVTSGGVLQSWFNRRGGEPTVELLGERKDITFPGLSLNGLTTIPVATVLGGTTGQIVVGFTPNAIRVETNDSAGTMDALGFSLLVYETSADG